MSTVDETYSGTSETARQSSTREIELLREPPNEALKNPNRVLAPHVIVNICNMPSTFDSRTAVKRHVEALGFNVAHGLNCVVRSNVAEI